MTDGRAPRLTLLTLIPPFVAIAGGASVVGLMMAQGWLASAHDTLVVMGFDPDRAQLLTSLLAGAIAGSVGTLVAANRVMASIGGLGIAAVVFSPTFLSETRAALSATGDQGRFDLGGWGLTLLALLTAGFVASWSAAVVAGEARAAIVDSLHVIRLAVRSRSLRNVRAWRPLVTLVAAITVAVALPVVADMLNYSPDAEMRVAAPGRPGLFGGGGPVSTTAPAPAASLAQPSATGSSQPASSGGAILPEGSPDASGLLPPISGGSGPVSTARPWLASRPTGPGRIIPKIHLPPPWTEGLDPYASLTVYLPPGYDESTQRYPVVYEVPWSFDLWDHAIHMAGMLDTLIDEGRIPPLIVAFVAQNGAPIPDTECIDSSDGHQQIETYMTTTVVAYMDHNFRTVTAPAGRALFGFSTGGFCAPMLLLRHPDVFGAAIAMSGYYHAAIQSGPTLNAWRPFGGVAELIASHSPILLLASVPPVTRRQLFLVVAGDSSEAFYGPEYVSFTDAVRDQGYQYLFLPTRLGHAWGAVRATLPSALEATAGWWVSLGVLGPS